MKRKRTFQAKKESVERRWYIVDAKGKVLGRMSAKIAVVLRGKNKASFSPHVDCGDFVVVINARDVRVTGKKETDKTYFSHSYYPGGDRITALEVLRDKKPEQIIKYSVRGMLPKGRLGEKMFKKLKVYGGSEHPHAAQAPKELKL